MFYRWPGLSAYYPSFLIPTLEQQVAIRLPFHFPIFTDENLYFWDVKHIQIANEKTELWLPYFWFPHTHS